ncbi:MAG: hypothetical protein ACT4N2_05875 [Hyphomicrobium sp.]
MSRMSKRLSFTLAVATGLAGPAVAAEYCVSCSSPDVSYRCEVESIAPSDARAWLLCVTELARQGGHDSCSVDRKVSTPCPGVHKVLAAPPGEAPLPPVNVETAVPVPGPPPHADPRTSPPSAAIGTGSGPRVPQTSPTAPDITPDDAIVDGTNVDGVPAPGEDAPPKRVPQTVEELAGDTLEASKKGLKSAGQTVADTAKKAGDAVSDTAKSAGETIGEAGSAVGNAAKKTWNCVTSLFQSC